MLTTMTPSVGWGAAACIAINSSSLFKAKTFALVKLKVRLIAVRVTAETTPRQTPKCWFYALALTIAFPFLGRLFIPTCTMYSQKHSISTKSHRLSRADALWRQITIIILSPFEAVTYVRAHFETQFYFGREAGARAAGQRGRRRRFVIQFGGK